jgi:mannose-6-phosphate isomerase-like protein (cupin superfamily)
MFAVAFVYSSDPTVNIDTGPSRCECTRGNGVGLGLDPPQADMPAASANTASSANGRQRRAAAGGERRQTDKRGTITAAQRGLVAGQRKGRGVLHLATQHGLALLDPRPRNDGPDRPRRSATGPITPCFDCVMPSDPTAADRQGVVDLTQAAARVSGAYANFVLSTVDDHVVRMSVMTEPFYWHRHPDSDETFLVIEGKVLLETTNARVELAPGQLYTVPAGLAHVTSPMTERSVNVTVEKATMTTERLPGQRR